MRLGTATSSIAHAPASTKTRLSNQTRRLKNISPAALAPGHDSHYDHETRDREAPFCSPFFGAAPVPRRTVQQQQTQVHILLRDEPSIRHRSLWVRYELVRAPLASSNLL